MRYITADQLFNGSTFLKSGSILAVNENGYLQDILQESEIEPSQVEKYTGIITPGFVNTHCHLELSYLHNAIESKKGLVNFAKNIIIKRIAFEKKDMLLAIEKADEYMQKAGIVAVGDISNTNISFYTKQKSKLYYHTFVELIGLDPKRSESILQMGIELLNELKAGKLNGSLAPHAPYSTSVQLIEAISNYDQKNNWPFSIHNQESAEEDKFMQGKASDFESLYEFLKIDISWFKPNFKSSLAAYCQVLKSQKNILVHNTFSSIEDLNSANSHIYWCLCPSANLYIENTLPNYHQLIQHTKQICFGTDSLASNSDLDILKEATIFYSQTHDLELTLQALTATGAEALTIQNNYGSYIIGKNAGLNLIEVVNGKLQLQKIIC